MPNIIKQIFVIILCIIDFKLGISQENIDTIIYWSQNHKLCVSDFNCKVPDSISNTVAVSMLLILPQVFIENKIPNYKIYAIFNKNGSWIKDSSSSILIHEQLHFDITELFVRKIRKRINELRRSNKTKIYISNNVFEELEKECNNESNEYDKQTHHGILYFKQKDWNKKIAKELENLKKYEDDYNK
jgi:hypothetical protein